MLRLCRARRGADTRRSCWKHATRSRTMVKSQRSSRLDCLMHWRWEATTSIAGGGRTGRLRRRSRHSRRRRWERDWRSSSWLEWRSTQEDTQEDARPDVIFMQQWLQMDGGSVEIVALHSARLLPSPQALRSLWPDALLSEPLVKLL